VRVKPVPAAVDELRAPEETKAYLRDHGLPRHAPLDFEFVFPEGRVPTLAEALGVPEAPALRRYRKLGQDAECHVCLDEGQAGAVYLVSVNPRIPTLFMNSSVPQMAACLEAAGAVIEELHRSKEGVASGARQAAHGSRLREALGAIDARAVASDTVWDAIVDQVRTGML